MPKFKILPKVDGFGQHKPGDIVELPERYRGINWLEPVDKPAEEKPKAELEPSVQEPQIPFETPKKPSRKKSKP